MLYVVDWYFNLDWCVAILDCCIGMMCGMYWTGVMDWCVVHVHVCTGLIHLPSGYVHNMTTLYYMSHDELTLLQALTSAPLSNITNTLAIWPFIDAMRSCSVKSILH